MNAEDIAMVVVALAVFAGVVYAAQFYRPAEATVGGIRVLGENPKEALALALSAGKILIREDLVNASDRRNSAVGAMGAEIAHALRSSDKNVSVYGVVDGVPGVNCNAENNQCSGATVIVRTGPCNCLDTRNRTMLVEGSADFLLENLVNIRGITKLVLAEANNASG